MKDMDGVKKESWSRKVMGALKDMASIGIAKTSNTSVLEKTVQITVLKATRHKDVPPKEKHVLTALSATGESESRCRLIFAVEKRMIRTRDWKVALKALALFHRLLREGGAAFALEIQHFSHRSVIEGMLSFEDPSSPYTLDISLWVRKYSCYLAQRLQCSRIFKYDIASDNRRARIKDFDIQYLLEYLPSMQLLLRCLLDCTPEECRVEINSLLQYALDLLLKECPNIYVNINVSISELLVSFFADMPRHKGRKLLDIYKRNLQQTEKLEMFYDKCRGISTGGLSVFPSVNKPSESVLSEMETYINKRADPACSIGWKIAFDPTDKSIHQLADEKDKSILDALNDSAKLGGDQTRSSEIVPPSLSFSEWILPQDPEIAEITQPQEQENNDTRPV